MGGSHPGSCSKQSLVTMSLEYVRPAVPSEKSIRTRMTIDCLECGPHRHGWARADHFVGAVALASEGTIRTGSSCMGVGLASRTCRVVGLFSQWDCTACNVAVGLQRGSPAISNYRLVRAPYVGPNRETKRSLFPAHCATSLHFASSLSPLGPVFLHPL
jgi:hypothetical protein